MLIQLCRICRTRPTHEAAPDLAGSGGAYETGDDEPCHPDTDAPLSDPYESKLTGAAGSRQ